MVGYTIECLPKTSVDFSGMAFPIVPQEVVLADQIGLLHWGEVTMAVRVHSHTLGAGTGTIVIGVYQQTVSDDDPGKTFLGLPGICSIALTSATPSPAYLTVSLNASFGSSPTMIRLVAQGFRLALGSLAATISIELSVKEG